MKTLATEGRFLGKADARNCHMCRLVVGRRRGPRVVLHSFSSSSSSSATPDAFRVSVAPMMDCTDRHFRYFVRQVSRHAVLYTEMVSTASIIASIQAAQARSGASLSDILARTRKDHHPPPRSSSAASVHMPQVRAPHANSHAPSPLGQLLGYSACEHPLVLQLGGSVPADLRFCAQVAQELGYDEVNLNVGCPSKNVKDGYFGAVLMKTPSLVASSVEEMKKGVQIPITVKHRIGVDELDSYEHMRSFVHQVSLAGCDRFIVHARKAWLKGLSPRENRTIPPILYDFVYRLKEEFPRLKVELNGDVKTMEDIRIHRQKGVDGVMIGRASYANPYLLATVDRDIHGDTAVMSRDDVVHKMISYVDQRLEEGDTTWSIVRHMLGLFANVPGGAKHWKKYLTEESKEGERGSDILREALALTKCGAVPGFGAGHSDLNLPWARPRSGLLQANADATTEGLLHPTGILNSVQEGT